MSEPNYFSEHPPYCQPEIDPQSVHIRILAEGWAAMRCGTLGRSQGAHVRQLGIVDTGKMLKLADSLKQGEVAA